MLSVVDSAILRKIQRFSRADTNHKVQYLKAYVRRVFSLLEKAFLTPAAYLLYAGLCLVDLFRSVRIGALNAKGRISIMVSYLEPYIRMLGLEGHRNPLLVVINPGRCPNEQLSKMYGRAGWLLDDRYPWLRKIMVLTPRSHLWLPLRCGHTCEFSGAWNDGRPVLTFTAEEEELGQRLLKDLGIPEGASYVCFGLRDAAYYQQFLTPEAQTRHPNPEAREDTYIRNPPLSNYLLMATTLAEQGIYVLRMGQIVGESLPEKLHPKIIDYARNYRTPFGDIYLPANCKFLVAGGAGLWWISTAFNRPVVLTDHYCIEMRPLRYGDLCIPKKLWLISEKRFLTFREMIHAGMRYSYESNCRCDGIEMLHNTADEVAAVAQEMCQRLEGTWVSDEEDEELQRRFDAVYLSKHAGYGMPGRIGAQFLRDYRELLE